MVGQNRKAGQASKHGLGGGFDYQSGYLTSPDGLWSLTFSEYSDPYEAHLSFPDMYGDAGVFRHDAEVRSVTFSPDGERIATASADKTVRIWSIGVDWPTMEPLRGASIAESDFSPDGSRILAGGANGARIWDPLTRKPLTAPLPHEASVMSVDFSPDGKLAVTGSLLGEAKSAVRIWDARTAKPHTEPISLEGEVAAVGFSPDSRSVLTVCFYEATSAAEARLWNATTAKPLGEPMRHGGRIRSIEFSPDGRLIVTGSEDKTARIWNAANGKPQGKPLLHERAIYSVVFSRDGGRVVTGSEDRTARIWDVATCRPVGEPMHHEGAVNTVSFSPEGSYLVTASADKSARLWNFITGQPIGTALRHEKPVTSAVFTPDGQFVLTGSGESVVRLWDLASRMPVGKPMDHFEWTEPRVTLDSGILRVATASDDHSFTVGPLQAITVSSEDLEMWAGRRINEIGQVEGIGQDERIRWRDRFAASARGKENEWHRILRWRLSDPRTRAITPYSGTPMPEHIEREITWEMAQLAVSGGFANPSKPASSDSYRDKSTLTEAYARDPLHPLIHLALAGVEDHSVRREFLKDYGLKRLAVEEAKSPKAAHHDFAGTYRAKAAAILWLQGDKKRAKEVFTMLLAQHDPQRATWGSQAWIEKLDDFTWPKPFRDSLIELAIRG